VIKWWKNNFPIIEEKKAKSLLHKFSGEEYKGYAINPYIGCQHRCVYCYATYEWFPEFFDKVLVKINAEEILKNEISLYGTDYPIMIASSTDPYQPVEILYRNTRKILNVLEKYKAEYFIFTKSILIKQDLDIHERNKERCWIIWSLTTINEEIKRKIEPFTASANRILEALRLFSDRGIRCGINIDPIMPFLTDNKEDLYQIVKLSKENGAKFISAGILRIRKDIWSRVKDFFVSINRKDLIKKYHELYFLKGEKDAGYLIADKNYSRYILTLIERFCKKENIQFGFPFEVPKLETSQCYIINQFKISDYF
jgi:DNA repair photolyase